MRLVNTEKLGNVPETEPKPRLDPLPDLVGGEVAKAKRIEETGRDLRHRAHRYSGVSKIKDVPQSDVDVAASQLYRAALRFAHAYEKTGPCTCIFCVT
jgi:hypothetical protein